MTRDLGDELPRNHSEERKPNLQMYNTVLNGIQEQIRFADSKAGFVAALNALLFGFLASHFNTITNAYDRPDNRVLLFGIAVTFLILYIIATTTSIILVILSVMSRFGELAPSSKVFFGHIHRQYGKNYGKFVRETMHMSDAEWAEEIGPQIVEVSHIALTKHKLVRRAAISTLAAFMLWIVALITIALIPSGSPVRLLLH